MRARCATRWRRTEPRLAALKAYEAQRLPATAAVVRMNRSNPPDAILREVYERTGDKPFDRIEDVISHDELVAISERYQRVDGCTVVADSARFESAAEVPRAFPCRGSPCSHIR